MRRHKKKSPLKNKKNLVRPRTSSTGGHRGDQSSWRYDFIKRIGRGNYGVAWLVKRAAVDGDVTDDISTTTATTTSSTSSTTATTTHGTAPDDGEHMVIKKIPLHSLKESEAAAAHLEVKLLKELVHPNIVKTYDSFIEDETLHIVMQYCEGGDLAVRIKNASRAKETFDRNLILEWMVQICSAVAYCHNHRILHRDLKTNNIFLARNNVIKLGDFGIARVLTHTLEQANTVIGTPFFMSPEVCSNMPYSFKSDVWSLGCILHELCTLEHAFKSNNLLGLVFKIMQDDTPSIPEEYGPEVNALLQILLDKNPDKRPSAQQILTYGCLSDAAKRIAETYERTGGLGADDVMLPPPSPPPTPKKKGYVDRSSTGGGGGDGSSKQTDKATSNHNESKISSSNSSNNNNNNNNSSNSKLASKHRAKNRLRVLNDEHMRASYGSNTTNAGKIVGKTAPRVARATSLPNDRTTQDTLEDATSHVELRRQRKQKKREEDNRSREEELRRANEEHMQQRALAKQRKLQEFQPSSVNHSIGYMGSPITRSDKSVIGKRGPTRLSIELSTEQQQHEEHQGNQGNQGNQEYQEQQQQYQSMLDMASPSHAASTNNGFDVDHGHGVQRAHSAPVYNEADERPIRASSTQQQPLRYGDGGGGRGHQRDYSWKEEGGNFGDMLMKEGVSTSPVGDVLPIESSEDDEYTDDEDFYSDDDFEDEEAVDNGIKHAPKANKYVQMNASENERRQEESRRDAEEVASAMRLVGTGERKDLVVLKEGKTNSSNANKNTVKMTSGEITKENPQTSSSEQDERDANDDGMVPSMSTDVRQSIQRIRFNCRQEAINGLGERVYSEIENLCRSVMQGSVKLPKRKLQTGNGKKRSPMEIEWMKIVGPENFEEKLKLCRKVEEVVTVEMCFKVR